MLSLWLDPQPSPRPALEGPVDCDVLVIGAGLCGAATALRLAREGVQVALLEARQVATAATGRNAGFILQGTAERYDRAVALLGRTRAREVHAWTVENHRRIAETQRAEGIDCDYQRRGSLQLAGSEIEEAELRASAALLREDGFDAELWEQAQLPEVHRARGHRMGVFVPGDGELNPALFVRGVVEAAERLGARVFEGSAVLGLDAATPGDVRAHTARGEVRAQAAVVAVNAYVGDLLPALADKVDPVRGQMLGTAPLPIRFDIPVYANHGYDYWRQDSQGRLALGGWRNLDPDTERGVDERLNDDIQARMSAFVADSFPGLDVAITHRWAGIMGFSRDGLPLVGPAPGVGGAAVGCGFTGHGFGFAFLAGEALAELVLEGQHPFCEAFDPRRF
ncbi:MAG: FAD-dependent oxidoreductase [Alphaproteobacteria bacterium]|nr:FAD-dependent oxidoreductase [Alphaproteobacteria bacterium]